MAFSLPDVVQVDSQLYNVQTVSITEKQLSTNIKTTVFCTLQFEGIHCWANCPIDEVAYLRDLHRHIFHIRAVKEVFHDDRDIEFIQFKNVLSSYIKNRYPKYHPEGNALLMDSTSCEMLARELIEEFGLIECEVNEDGENGAILKVV